MPKQEIIEEIYKVQLELKKLQANLTKLIGNL